MALVLVECISQYRMRYVVEAPDTHPEYALDTVVCEEAKEFSQHWLGETIVSHRTVSAQDIMKMLDEDNGYCKEWSDDHKIKTFITLESDLKK